MASYLPDLPDAVIVGGGLIGCAIAFELAERGLGVTVVERDLPGRAASWAAAGMLSPIGLDDRQTSFHALLQASLAAFPAFLAHVTEYCSVPVEFGVPGKLEVAFNDAAALRLASLLGIPGVRLLSGAEARQLEPGLTDAVVAALQFPEDAYVDNRALGAALWQAAEQRGVRFRTGQPAAALRSHNGRTTGIQLRSGEILSGGAVVITAGAWSGLLAGLPRPLPVFPVRGQMCALHSRPRPFNAMLHSEHCYLISRAEGRTLVGATVESVGFDPRITAGAVHALLSAAIELVPSLAGAELTEAWTGFRPGTPDSLPILGADPALEGLFYATGHFRNGVLLAPITGTLVADMVAGLPLAWSLDDFKPDRFDERAHEV